MKNMPSDGEMKVHPYIFYYILFTTAPASLLPTFESETLTYQQGSRANFFVNKPARAYHFEKAHSAHEHSYMYRVHAQLAGDREATDHVISWVGTFARAELKSNRQGERRENEPCGP